MKKFKYLFINSVLCLIFTNNLFAVDVPISLFPLDNYNQSINQWISPDNPGYNKRLLSSDYQKQRLQEFYNHLYSTNTRSSSPWSSNYIHKIFNQQPDLKTLEENLIEWYSNQNKDPNHVGYGENFRPHTLEWMNDIYENINVNQFSKLEYNENNRAITVANLNTRVLPTDDLDFYNFTLAGQGYPFDNLQMSSLWAGTPVYIVAQSKDKAWDYVVTPSFIAWVHSSGIAPVPKSFVYKWSQAVKKMAATVHTKTSIIDENGHFQFYAYVGSVFPLIKGEGDYITILIPERGKNGFSTIHTSNISKKNMVRMPFPATPHNFSTIITTLLNRPYGWDGLNFYNDCSQELKSLYTPFAIWLPRDSSNQVKTGKMVDKSSSNLDQRLEFLVEKGHPLMTIIYIGGHVILYLGRYPTILSEKLMAMTYQNVWGLSPPDRERRSVIGESVLFPLLRQYPEDPSLDSLANKKYFQVSFLDEWPSLLQIPPFELKPLVYPEYMLSDFQNY